MIGEIFQIGRVVTSLRKKLFERLIREKLTYSKDDLATKDIHSTFQRIYQMLWLDMTCLLEPGTIEESIRVKSFGERGYFKKLEKDRTEKYKFRFFEKKNSDRNVTATVDINDAKIILELNLKKKDIERLKEIFRKNNYKLLPK